VDSPNVAPGLAGIATSPNDKYIYVTSAQSILTGTAGTNMVYAISTATNTVVSSVDIGNSPVGIAFTPNGQFVYVPTPNGTGGSVTVINTNTNTQRPSECGSQFFRDPH
jgi:YVTN family beta-propeller protein